MNASSYEEQIQLLKDLKAKGVDKEILHREAKLLNELKQHSRYKRKFSYRESSDLKNNLKIYQNYYMQLPVDVDGFVTSFESSSTGLKSSHDYKKSVLSFFNCYGFVVFRNVLTEDDCKLTRGEIWDFLENDNYGFQRSDPNTYYKLSSHTYGLAPKPAIFSPQVVRNRYNPKVISSFRILLNEDDILVTHDRWCAYRPTRNILINGKLRDMPEWRTAENLHLDLNPWTYFSDTLPLEDLTYDQLRDFSKEINSVTHRSGPNVQGLIALNHNRVNDGGTVVLSGFHKCFKLWRDSLGSMYENIHKDSKESGHLVWRGNGAGSYKFAQSDPIHQFKQRITMRAGSLLIWDQRIVHGAAHNDSSNFRLAQFIKAFRRSPISDTRLSLRSKRIEAELSLNSSTEQITSAARRLLGISTFSD